MSKKMKIALTCIGILIENEENEKRDYSRKKYAVHPMFQNRDEYGYYKVTFPIIKLDDIKFREFCRFNATQFEELLFNVASILKRQTFLREPVSPEERLLITLRYINI